MKSMNYRTIILFLITFNCFSQIIDKSEDVSHDNYSFRLSKKDFSHRDFSLEVQYYFANTFSGYPNSYTKHDLLDFYKPGGCQFKKVNRKRENLSNKEILIRRYSAYKVKNFEVGQITKMESELESLVLEAMIKNLNLVTPKDVELEFIAKEDYIVVPNKHLESSSLPIRLAFYSTFMNLNTNKLIKEYKPKLDAVLYETRTNQVEVFPILILHERESLPPILLIDLYFAENNKELRYDTFIINLVPVDFIDSQLVLKMIEIGFQKTYQRINTDEAFLFN